MVPMKWRALRLPKITEREEGTRKKSSLQGSNALVETIEGRKRGARNFRGDARERRVGLQPGRTPLKPRGSNSKGVGGTAIVARAAGGEEKGGRAQ